MNATTAEASHSATTVLPEPAQLAVPYAGPSSNGVGAESGIVDHGPYVPVAYRAGVSLAGRSDPSEAASQFVAEETLSAESERDVEASQETGDLPWIDVFLDRESGEGSALDAAEPYASPESSSEDGPDEATVQESGIGMEILPALHVEDEAPSLNQSGLAFYSKAAESTYDEASIDNVGVSESEGEARGGAIDTLVSERAALILEGVAARVRRREIAVDELSLSSSEGAVLSTVLSALLRAG